MRTSLAPVTILASLLSLTHAVPSDPSATVTTTSSALPTVTAQAIVNGTKHLVKIAEKLAVDPSAISSTAIASASSIAHSFSNKEVIRPGLLPPVDDNLYTINYKLSDVKGSSYCSPRYKSFWYNNWTTDPMKRPAACNAVAHNYAGKQQGSNNTKMDNGGIFWGPEKDGTNVCYWHFTCDYEEEIVGDFWDSGPQITYNNVQNIAQAWYDPANWPKNQAPRACGHIWLDRANSLNQCRLTVSIIAYDTGVLTGAGWSW